MCSLSILFSFRWYSLCKDSIISFSLWLFVLFRRTFSSSLLFRFFFSSISISVILFDNSFVSKCNSVSRSIYFFFIFLFSFSNSITLFLDFTDFFDIALISCSYSVTLFSATFKACLVRTNSSWYISSLFNISLFIFDISFLCFEFKSSSFSSFSFKRTYNFCMSFCNVCSIFFHFVINVLYLASKVLLLSCIVVVNTFLPSFIVFFNTVWFFWISVLWTFFSFSNNSLILVKSFSNVLILNSIRSVISLCSTSLILPWDSEWCWFWMFFNVFLCSSCIVLTFLLFVLCINTISDSNWLFLSSKAFDVSW